MHIIFPSSDLGYLKSLCDVANKEARSPCQFEGRCSTLLAELRTCMMTRYLYGQELGIVIFVRPDPTLRAYNY